MNSPQTDHSYKWAGGGFIASTSDIARFAMAHISGDYLNQETVEQVFREAKTNDGKTVDFGIGWQIGFDRYRESYADNPEDIRLMNEHPNSVMHSGGSMGGTTMMILCRKHYRAVVVVKNVSGSEVGRPLVLALKTLDAFSQH